MSTYTSETQVRVCSFVRREEGDSVTIGDLDRHVFLTIPTEALTILDCLAEGETVGHARDRYQATYGEAPDIEDFLEALEAEGFVFAAAAHHDQIDTLPPVPPGPSRAPLDWPSQSRAAALCRPSVIVTCCLLVTLAAVLIATDPATVPGPTVLVFKRYLALFSLGIFAFALVGMAVHELAHLIAARAAGVRCRIGVSHRLWIVVAETDMTGIWMAPRRDRYRAFLAGPLVDAVFGSLLVGVLWIHRRGWIALTALEAQVVGACLMVYLLRLVWQCFVFVRTDFYFVAATAFNCKNLLVDTEDFLHNRVARILRRPRPVDQSGIPAVEMRVVKWYSLLWLAGRTAALATLLCVTLPVMWRYVAAIAPLFVGGRSRYGVADALAFGIVTVVVEGAGLVMWLRSLLRRLNRLLERNSNAVATL